MIKLKDKHVIKPTDISSGLIRIIDTVSAWITGGIIDVDKIKSDNAYLALVNNCGRNPEDLIEAVRKLSSNRPEAITEFLVVLKDLVEQFALQLEEEEKRIADGLLKEELKRLEQQVQRDPMTGLLNKKATQFSIDEFLDSSDPSSVHALMIIDIDDFKSVNDTFGHLFGDMVIENVAAAISSTFRKSDIIGRIGGDEFLLLMKNTGKRIAEIKARELSKKVKRTYYKELKQIEVSVSIGIAFFGSDGSNYEELFGKADIAMYNSKLQGKDTVEAYDAGKEQRLAGITAEDYVGRRGTTADYDVEFVNTAFELLQQSRDLETSIQILLERLADKYSLQTILYNYTDNNSDELIIHWNNETGITHRRQDEEDFISFEALELQDKEFVVINDCNREDTEKSFADYIAKYGVTAIVGCKIEISADKTEFLCYMNTDAPRNWTEYEKHTFKHLSSIISVFSRLYREQRKNYDHIKALSKRDVVTGLYNRDSFVDEIKKILKEYKDTKNYYITYIDIDNFSYVNENFGIVAGDRILRDLAGILKSIKDSFACRIYADYFVLFQYRDKEFDIEETSTVQEEFFEKQQKMIYSAGKLRLTAGFYKLCSWNEDIALAIDNANLARKQAKEKELVWCEFDRKIRDERNFEQFIAGSFEGAIERQEFEMVLQPKVNLATGNVYGAEAFVRWRLPNGNYRMPNDFIRILEKYNFIQKMDFVILELTLQTLEKWEKVGHDLLPVSINFSMINTNSKDFVDRFLNTFKQHKVDRRLIEIEVQENALQRDRDILFDNLRRLNNLGFGVILDSFGRGFSSLSVLLSAPVSMVKIDKIFLMGMDDSIIQQDYVANLCTLISSAKKSIIFEGVETIEQENFLSACGISMAQGYLYGKPVGAEEFATKYLEL